MENSTILTKADCRVGKRVAFEAKRDSYGYPVENPIPYVGVIDVIYRDSVGIWVSDSRHRGGGYLTAVPFDEFEQQKLTSR